MIRRLPFADTTQAALIYKSILSRIDKRVSELRAPFVSPSNAYRMKHGRQWKTMHSDNPEEPGSMVKHSLETETSFQRVINHDLAILPAQIRRIVSKIHESFIQTLVATLEESTEKTGNVVAAQGRSLQDSLQDILSKIAFGVEKTGKPSGPHVMGPSGVPMPLEDLISSLPKDKQLTLYPIIEQKCRDALADEAKRISKYRIRV